MLYKFQYTNYSERDTILNQNTDKYLREEQNITEGNFLIFSDELTPEDEVVLLKQQVADLEIQVTQLIGGVV